MTDMNGITEETLDAVRKAQTAGVIGTTGLYGYDLSGVVSLVPVVTPWFERVKREQGDGSQAAHWRALLNINNSQPNPFTGIDGGGSFVQFAEQDVLAQYQPVRLSGKVTQDAIALAKNYADAKALAVTGSLMQWRIAENKALLAGQNFALPTIGAVTLVASASGGTIGASKVVHVRAAARSGYNYYYGGSGVASTDVSVTVSAGTTNSVAASVPAVRGAAAYDWYVGIGAGTVYYVGTTTVNKFTVTAEPSANAAVPNFPSLSSIAPTTVPATDTSYNANAYNGLLATLSGDYGTNGLVTPGSGTPSGATFQTLDGATLTGSAQGITEIDNLFQSIFDATSLSPTALLMNAQASKDIKARVFGGGNAVTYLEPQGNGRAGATAGGSVARYINGSAAGAEVEIVVDPHIPPGQIVAVTERVPYPNSGIANTFAARTLRDVAEFDYGVSLTPGANGGPREEWDISSLETFVNKAPVTCGVITNIAAG